jgi:uncharacterized protein YacL (UPF0231 family)
MFPSLKKNYPRGLSKNSIKKIKHEQPGNQDIKYHDVEVVAGCGMSDFFTPIETFWFFLGSCH